MHNAIIMQLTILKMSASDLFLVYSLVQVIPNR